MGILSSHTRTGTGLLGGLLGRGRQHAHPGSPARAGPHGWCCAELKHRGAATLQTEFVPLILQRVSIWDDLRFTGHQF